MESSQLLDVIYDGKPFVDQTHLQLIYKEFQQQQNIQNVELQNPADDSESQIPLELQHISRVKEMRKFFRWIPIPCEYFKRFQKNSEMSTQFRERANKYLYSTDMEEGQSLLKALRGYNLAIAFALPNSTELALAYEKRVDLFLRLEKPGLAQQDIHSTATNLAYPMKSASKLIELQNRCTNMSNSVSKKYASSSKNDGARRYTEKEFYKLKTKHLSISNVADFMEIDYKPHCGRRLLVNREVKPGEVLMIDEPYSLILEKILKWDMEHCTNCSKPILAGIPCNSCTFGWFCSLRCLESASRGVHKYEHNYLSYLRTSEIMSLKGLLASRILFKVGPEELYRIFISKDPLYFPSLNDSSPSDPKYRGYTPTKNSPIGLSYSSTSYLPIYHLISHPHFNPLKSKSNTFKALLMTHLIEDSSDFFLRYKYKDDFEEFRDFIASLLLRHMESIDYNAITLSELGGGLKGQQGTIRYGAAVYPVLCLINHSCDPNCVPVRSLRFLKTAVVAMKSLKPGDEVTFSYAPHFAQMDVEERRKFLFDRYNFMCKCEPCLCAWGPLNCKSYFVPESQCNACGRYLLIGQCPKCAVRDVEIRRDLPLFQNQLHILKELVKEAKFVEGMEIVKPCLEFCSDNFAPNFALSLEFQEIFKLILVGLVNL